MHEPLFQANRGLPTFERPPHVDGSGFSAIRAAVLAERQAYANAATLDDLAVKSEAAGLTAVAAGYRRAARAERASGRAATSRWRPGPSTFDGPQPALLPGQMRLGDG